MDCPCFYFWLGWPSLPFGWRHRISHFSFSPLRASQNWDKESITWVQVVSLLVLVSSSSFSPPRDRHPDRAPAAAGSCCSPRGSQHTRCCRRPRRPPPACCAPTAPSAPVVALPPPSANQRTPAPPHPRPLRPRCRRRLPRGRCPPPVGTRRDPLLPARSYQLARPLRLPDSEVSVPPPTT